MRYRLVVIVLVVLALAIVREALTHAKSPAPKLSSAASSINSLVEDLRLALINKDKTTLRTLRVNQDEYLGLILPGSVEPGQKPAEWSGQAQEYFWGMLNGKSIYVEANLLDTYGGHPFRVTDIRYVKGIKEYALYKAYKQLELTLEDDAGKVDHLRIGSIAEVDGRYKFISYVRD